MKSKYWKWMLPASLFLVSACSGSQAAADEPPADIPTPTPTPEVTAEPEPAETAGDVINRPVIVHKADVVYFDRGDSFMDFSENVESVTDAEDGEIPYDNIGGLEDYTEEEVYALTHPADRPELAGQIGNGLYFTLSYQHEYYQFHEELTCVTTAFDSEGHASWKEYKIITLFADENDSIGSLNILSDQVEVRNQNALSGILMGYVVRTRSYWVFEIQKGDGFFWYRIGNDLWIQDDGRSVEFMSGF